MSAGVLLAVLLGLIAAGMPIGFALLAAAVLVIAVDPQASLVIVPLRLTHGTDSFAMIAVPLFILAGALMNQAGISARLVAFAASLVGWVRGGLALTTTATSMLFSEISGSAVADAAALGSVLVPAMTARGYPAAFAAAVLSSSATIAILIPPSIPMILYGSITGTSIARLFLAGVVPGVLVGASIMATSLVLARVHGFADREPFEWRRVRRTFREACWPLTLPAIILGGIFSGVFTATEAAAVAVVAAAAMAVAGRRLGASTARAALHESAQQTGAVMILVAASAVLGWYLANEQLPEALAGAVTARVTGHAALLLALNAIFLLAGMVLHSAAAIVLLVPIVQPLADAAGLDPVHLGIMITVNLAIGQQTPPVASVLMTSCAIAGARVGDVMKVNVLFVGAMIAVLALVTFVPGVSLWLPDLVEPR